MNNKWISEYINEISDTNEDTDLGHTDNEPDMLSSDLSVIARYAAELKDVMDTLSNTNDEIDLPHWWQAKVIKAKDYLIGAKHYLRAELEKNQSNTITSEDYKKKLEERVMELTEKNVPTDSSKWSYYKAQAKKKFDVYPSAYANGWAAKKYKAAGGGWKTENKESMDEAKSMDTSKRLKIYDKLKKGDEITIKYGSSMSSGREAKFKVTKGKTLVGKEKVERIILQNVANPKGVKYYLYQRNGNVTMAIGDMGATIEDMYESVVNEAKEPEVITKLRKIVKDSQNDLIKDTKTGRKIRVDMNSANLMIQVYDALKSQSNKDKFVNGGVVSMGLMAFKLMKKENTSEVIEEGEYQGRKVELNKPMQGDVKKFKVYVNNEKGNVVKVNFGQKGMVIKKDNPAARKSFRARMNCDSPGPKWKANYWSCRKW